MADNLLSEDVVVDAFFAEEVEAVLDDQRISNWILTN
jgi:hypothetical protein